MTTLLRVLSRDLDIPDLSVRKLIGYTVAAAFWLLMAGVLYVAAVVTFS